MTEVTEELGEAAAVARLRTITDATSPAAGRTGRAPCHRPSSTAALTRIKPLGVGAEKVVGHIAERPLAEHPGEVSGLEDR